jgi:hypothetical protein
MNEQILSFNLQAEAHTSQPSPPLKNPVNPDSKPYYRINPNYPHG